MTDVTKNRDPRQGKLEPLMSLLICAFLIASVGITWCWCHFWSCGAVLSALNLQRAWHFESHSMFGSNLLSTCHVQKPFSRRPLVKMTWQTHCPLKLHVPPGKSFMLIFAVAVRDAGSVIIYECGRELYNQTCISNNYPISFSNMRLHVLL